MRAALGKVVRVLDVPSQQVTRLIVELPIETHVLATKEFYSQSVLVTLAPKELQDRPYGIVDSEAPQEPATEKPPGDLCRMAAMWCKDPVFLNWLRMFHLVACDEVIDELEDRPCSGEDLAARVVRDLCGVVTRRDLDTNPDAAKKFHELIRRPYLAYLGQR